MKRVTLFIASKFLVVWDLRNWLKKQGIETKIVTKHALQINPEFESLAKEKLRSYPYKVE